MQRTMTFPVALFLCAAANAQDGGFPPPQVQVASVETRDLASNIEVAGSVVSLNSARIAAEVEGVVTEVSPVGTRVERGDVLATLDPRLLNVQVAKARAAVARLESDLVFREQQLQRAEGLAKANNTSAHLVDEARANRDATFHMLADARADLERAEGDAQRATVRAPFAGHVTERLVAVGEYISMGEDLLRLVDTSQREISVPVPIALIPFVSEGKELSARRTSTDAASLPIRAVVPVADQASRMAEIRLSANGAGWPVGTPVQVVLPSSEPVTSLAVPRDALVERSGRTYVYRVTTEGTAEQLEPDIGSVVGLWVAVEGVDLVEGDQVIVRGAERLAPGQPVAVADGG